MYLNISYSIKRRAGTSVKPKHRMYLNFRTDWYKTTEGKVKPKHRMYLNDFGYQRYL